MLCHTYNYTLYAIKKNLYRLGSFSIMWYTVTIIYSIILLVVVPIGMHTYNWLILYRLIDVSGPLISNYPHQLAQHPHT